MGTRPKHHPALAHLGSVAAALPGLASRCSPASAADARNPGIMAARGLIQRQSRPDSASGYSGWRPTSKWARCSMAGIGTVEAIGLSPPKAPVRPRLPRRPKLSLFISARPKSPLGGKEERSSPEVAASSFPAVKRGLGRLPAKPLPWGFVAASFCHDLRTPGLTHELYT